MEIIIDQKFITAAGDLYEHVLQLDRKFGTALCLYTLASTVASCVVMQPNPDEAMIEFFAMCTAKLDDAKEAKEDLKL